MTSPFQLHFCNPKGEPSAPRSDDHLFLLLHARITVRNILIGQDGSHVLFAAFSTLELTASR